MSTPYKGFTIPEYTDPADGPTAFSDLVDSGPVPRFADDAARDAAIATPVAGQVVWNATPGEFQSYDGAAWVQMVPAERAFLDEDTLVSDSATAVASQQSIKAYVDALPAAPETATGSYSGNESSDRTITIGFTPILCVVMPAGSGIAGQGWLITTATAYQYQQSGGSPQQSAKITTNGILVGIGTDAIHLNKSGVTYYYTAIG